MMFTKSVIFFLTGVALFYSCTNNTLEFEKKRFLESTSAQLSTRPVPTLGTTYSFALVGDFHISHDTDNKIVKKFFDLVKDDPVNFVITLGDITNTGKENQFQAFNDILTASSVSYFFPVIGNHDI